MEIKLYCYTVISLHIQYFNSNKFIRKSKELFKNLQENYLYTHIKHIMLTKMIDPTKYLKIKYLKKISFLYSNTGLSYFLTLLKYMCDNEYYFQPLASH